MSFVRGKLIRLGHVALQAREANKWDAYRRFMDLIDEAIGEWKAQEPDRFWDHRDPEYQRLSKQWAIAREARYAHS